MYIYMYTYLHNCLRSEIKPWIDTFQIWSLIRSIVVFIGKDKQTFLVGSRGFHMPGSQCTAPAIQLTVCCSSGLLLCKLGMY